MELGPSRVKFFGQREVSMTENNPYLSPKEPSHPAPGPQSNAGMLPEGHCPHCGGETDNIKVFEVLERAYFFLAFFSFRMRVYAACPACMRQIVWRCCRSNVLSANLL